MSKICLVSVRGAEGSGATSGLSRDALGQYSASPLAKSTRRTFKAKVDVSKVDAELGILWGYASVADLLDLEGEIVPQDELIPAVYAFMEAYYSGHAGIKVNHDKPAAAVLVESTFHVIGTRIAWFVGVKLLDDDLRQAARDGEISGFSIGGSTDREEESDAD